jgi:hypothetical protein
MVRARHRRAWTPSAAVARGSSPLAVHVSRRSITSRPARRHVAAVMAFLPHLTSTRRASCGLTLQNVTRNSQDAERLDPTLVRQRATS